MINCRHVYFYWGGPLLFGPAQCISLGGPDPPDPPRESTRLIVHKTGVTGVAIMQIKIAYFIFNILCMY